ncbi:argininosuccinate lyase [Legionella sp. W05-934-2]|uniref:argininosuccinate lyase n=1 Tax=Legionella sp. W05-934-2 TaxID=1198649 RepID=UPI003461E183
MKLWGGRFNQETHALVDEYCASIQFDQALAEFDIQGSLAHVTMLGKCHLISEESANKIRHGLVTIHDRIKRQEVSFSVADEDIHMNIERLLFELIGEEAGKLHTGRSRNDQVALDLHLYMRYHLLQNIGLLHQLAMAFMELANTHIDVIMPGYTHLQRAEPVRFAHHMMAYCFMFIRDIQRLKNLFASVNISPLGAGALAGSGVAVDRAYVASLLNFDGVYENSLDAVSNRDFIAEFLFDASLIMMHLSKLSEEIILWSSQEFSFITLDDAFCTGSSMMPQKKNPDVAELARGKVGRVYGSLMGLLTTLKGLPLAYNKDLQEDKEGLFDVVKTLTNTLTIYPEMLKSMAIQQETMLSAVENDFSNATQLANYLTQKGLTFRQAHEVTGQLVRHCLEQNQTLLTLPLSTLMSFCSAFEEDVYACLACEQVVEAHSAHGGTAKASVLAQINQAGHDLQHVADWLAKKSEVLQVKVS